MSPYSYSLTAPLVKLPSLCLPLQPHCKYTLRQNISIMSDSPTTHRRCSVNSGELIPFLLFCTVNSKGAPGLYPTPVNFFSETL